ncbi:MAG: YggT family protein [Acidobacteria bacterium]|nr:YggT family protein [Acidobacteriota bacterium]
MLSLTVYPIVWLILWGIFLVFLALMILRLIFNYSDPNPFGKIGRFGFKIRRITERWVYPAARFLAGFRVDVRLAPLLVIFLGLVLTYFVSQIIGNTFFIIDGMSAAITTGNVKATIGFIIYALLSLLILLILVRFISQWFVYTQNTFLGFVRRVTDPIMLPFQKLIPQVGMFDISAMVVLIIIFLLQAVVMRTLILS